MVSATKTMSNPVPWLEVEVSRSTSKIPKDLATAEVQIRVICPSGETRVSARTTCGHHLATSQKPNRYQRRCAVVAIIETGNRCCSLLCSRNDDNTRLHLGQESPGWNHTKDDLLMPST